MKTAKRIAALFLMLVCLSVLTVPALATGYGYAVIDKVLIQLSNPPVVMMNPANIHVTTSTAGCYVAASGWYDVYSQPVASAFQSDYATLVVQIAAAGGYLFSDSLSVYINNESVSCTVADGGASATVSRQYVPSVWAPTVNKHPGGDKVDEGGTVSFVATADYADSSTWKVLDSDGELWTMEELAYAYPNFTYHDSFGKIIMNGVPSELDGAEICCTFDGPGGKVDTNWATLKVNYEVVETPAPTPSPTPAPTPKPTPAPTPTPAVTVHTHSFSSDWSYDEDIHWRKCECGEKGDFAPHSLTWKTVKEATFKTPGTEKGVCSVCGYEKERELEYEGIELSERIVKIIIIAAIALLVLIAGLIIALKIKRQKELERRRREALRRKRQQQARRE